jgi:hypothetical protein
MELTLRAAHKLVEKLNAHIKTIEVNPLVTVNTFEIDNAADLFAQHQKVFDENMERLADVQEVRNYLRLEIGKQNAGSIDTLIAQRKFAIERLAAYNRILETAKQEGQITTAAALERKIKSETTSKRESLYGRSDTVTFSLVNKSTKTILEGMVAAAKRAIEQTEDDLLRYNISLKVVLTDKHVEVLKKERLI